MSEVPEWEDEPAAAPPAKGRPARRLPPPTWCRRSGRRPARPCCGAGAAAVLRLRRRVRAGETALHLRSSRRPAGSEPLGCRVVALPGGDQSPRRAVARVGGAAPRGHLRHERVVARSRGPSHADAHAPGGAVRFIPRSERRGRAAAVHPAAGGDVRRRPFAAGLTPPYLPSVAPASGCQGLVRVAARCPVGAPLTARAIRRGVLRRGIIEFWPRCQDRRFRDTT